MGTYDTRGGTPISPRDDHPDPTELEEAVLGLLEAADFSTEVCDKIMSLIYAEEVRMCHEADEDEDFTEGLGPDDPNAPDGVM